MKGGRENEEKVEDKMQTCGLFEALQRDTSKKGWLTLSNVIDLFTVFMCFFLCIPTKPVSEGENCSVPF